MKELGGVFRMVGTTRMKVYDVTNTTGGLWKPAAFLCSSETADVDFEIYIDKNVNDLLRPGPLTLTPATTGGTIPRSTKVYVRVTPVDGDDVEGPASWGNVSTTTGSGTDTNKIGVSWPAVTGAAGYKVYAGTQPGMEAFVDVVVGTSMDITVLPANAVDEIITQPSFYFFGAATRLDTIALQDMYIASRLQIFGAAAATTSVSISIPLK